MIFKKLMLCGFIFLFASCATRQQAEIDNTTDLKQESGVQLPEGTAPVESVSTSQIQNSEKTDESIKQANKEFESGNYLQYLTLMDPYIKGTKQLPDIQILKSIGDAYFYLSNYDQAIAAYKKIVELQKSTPTGLVGEALYKIGLSYELMGRDDRAIATYLDALKRKKNLSVEVSELEIPARLGMTYMRIGQLKTARQYLTRAEKGMQKLKARLMDYSGRSKWLAEIFYGMGFTSSQIQSTNNFDDFVYALEHAQNYLLFSVELNDPVWSKAASEELLKIYQNALGHIQSLKLEPAKNVLAAKRELQDRQKKMSYVALDQIENLHDMILPEVENDFLKKVKAELQGLEKQFNEIVNARPLGEGITDEAKRFEQPKREGKIKDE